MYAYSLSAGDFDRNGVDDLAIGSPTADVQWGGYTSMWSIDMGGSAHDRGSVSVLYGTRGNYLHRAVSQHITSASFNDVDKNEDSWHDGSVFFGASLAAGDLNADGWDDLAIGTPGLSHGQKYSGGVAVRYGNPLGYGLREGHGARAEAWTQDDLGQLNQPRDYFGASLAIGDVDDNGINDLVIGIPGKDLSHTQLNGQRTTVVDQGAVGVLKGYSRSRGLEPYRSEFLHQNNLSTWRKNSGSHGEYFGASVATGNIDGKAVDEIIAAIPMENLPEELRNPRPSLNAHKSSSVHVITRKRAVDFHRTPVPKYEAQDYIWALLGDGRTTGKSGSILRGEATLSQGDYYGW